MSNNLNQRYPSYLIMVIKAILDSPERRLLLQDIYRYIKHNYPHVISNHISWQNSVRHNLSTHGCFYRTRNLNRGASYWGIWEQFIPFFEKNDFSRRWATGPKRRQETHPIYTPSCHDPKNMAGQKMMPFVNPEAINQAVPRNDMFQYQLWNYYLQNPIPYYDYPQQPSIQATTQAMTESEISTSIPQTTAIYFPQQMINPYQYFQNNNYGI